MLNVVGVEAEDACLELVQGALNGFGVTADLVSANLSGGGFGTHPSNVASPQPKLPASSVILTNNHLGTTRKYSRFLMGAMVVGSDSQWQSSRLEDFEAPSAAGSSSRIRSAGPGFGAGNSD